ncbi:MAG: 6-phosphogluconolactonase [Thermoplasmata archaeon]
MEPVVARFVHIYPTLASASSALARHLSQAARRSVRARGVFSWVVAGGHTPEGLYGLLASEYRVRFPWKETELFFGDERCVGPRAPFSNYRMVRKSLISLVPLRRRNVHRMPGEVRPTSAAARVYAREIESTRPHDRASPRFDVVLLGIGPDGHTASLFPRAPALRERRRTVVPVLRAGQPPLVHRLTLTLPALASSREVCFLISGSDKAEVVGEIFRSFPQGSTALPASLVRSQGPTHWYLDRAAAAELPSSIARAAASRPAQNHRTSS